MCKMKNYLIVTALAFCVGVLPMSAQTKADSVVAEVEEQVDGVVAYSDTTGVGSDADSAYVTISRGGKNIRLSVPADWIDDDEFTTANGSVQINGLNDLMSTLRGLLDDNALPLMGTAFGAVGLATIVILIVLLLFVILPLIILAFFLRYLVKRHNQNVEKRNEFQSQTTQRDAGQNTPFVGEPAYDPLEDKGHLVDNASYQWQRGVRNTSIGVGLALFFKIMGLDGLVGLGLLIAILGIGQMVIAKTSK